MDIEKLIEQYRNAADYWRKNKPDSPDVASSYEQAATALSALQAENAEMQKQLNEFSEFLCYMTGGLLSKTNYTAQEMISAAEDYQQKVCGECDLRAENEKLRAELDDLRIQWDMYGGDVGITAVYKELEQVKRERDAAVSWAQKYTESIDRPCVACKHNTGDYVCTAICGNCGPMGTESCKWEFDFSGELKEE